MFRFAVTLLASLFVGCGPSSTAHPREFLPITLRFGIYLARVEITTTIDAAGHLRRVRIDGKSYGPRDTNPSSERIEIRDGMLTAAQLDQLDADLARCTGPTSAAGVADGPDIRLERDGQPLFNGGDPPEPVRRVIDEINRLADAMPVTR